MWGNLKNLGSKMEQIGSAIAPVLAADRGEEYSDEDEYYEEDDYEDEEYEQKNNAAPFGFVGLITKALDREQNDYSHSHPDEGEEEEVVDLIPEEDDDDDDGPDYYPKQQQQFNENSNTLFQESHPPDASSKQDWSDSYDHVPASTLHVEEQFPISPSTKLRHASQLMMVSVEHNSDSNSNREKISIPHSQTKNAAIPKHETVSVVHHSDNNKHSMPPLSPYTQEQVASYDQPLQGPATKQQTRSSSDLSKRSPASSKVMLPTEPRRPSLIREKGSVSPNTPKVTKPVARDLGLSSNNEEMVVGIQSPSHDNNKPKRPSFLYAPPLASEASSDDDVAAAEDDDDEDEDTEEGEDQDETDMSSTRLTKDAIEAQQPKETASPPKSNSMATAHSASSTSPGQKQRQAFQLPPPRPVSSPGTPPNPLRSSPPVNHDSKPVPPVPAMKDTKEAQMIEELRRQCQKLDTQWKQSESQVQSLRKQMADASKYTNHDEALFIQFQEKEARLLEAAAEEHQQQLDLLRGELEGKLGAIQRQLKHEQAERQQEKQKLDRQLEDARRRAEAVEREAKLVQAKQEVELSNKARALEHSLRISEDKLARSMALLDERDEEMATLKKNLKNLQSTVTEHREGAEEVEEEIDELHAENESLRQHVEVVEAQCTQLKIKVEELQGDSEKLTALKVRSGVR